jgi:hypothetical protein
MRGPVGIRSVRGKRKSISASLQRLCALREFPSSSLRSRSGNPCVACPAYGGALIVVDAKYGIMECTIDTDFVVESRGLWQ